MSPSSKWGPPIWRFIHCLVENIKEDQFHVIGLPVFGIIKQICKNLPCPDCSMHATNFLSSVRFQHIKNKNDFVFLMFIFHNSVRKRKNQSIFHENHLTEYKKCNIHQCFNQFVDAYKTTGDMKMLADTFAREVTVRQVKQFLLKNRKLFVIYNPSTVNSRVPLLA